MSLHNICLNITNVNVLSKFKFFSKDTSIYEGYTANYNDIITLFPDENEKYRKQFSITAQRTKYISQRYEIESCAALSECPEVVSAMLKKTNNTDSSFLLQLLKDGTLVAFCCYVMESQCTVVKTFVTSDDVCKASVGHCFFSIIEDIVLMESNQLKPIIIWNIQRKDINLMTYEGKKMMKFLKQKEAKVFNSTTLKSLQTLLTKYTKVIHKCSKEFEIINWIVYKPTFMINAHDVYKKSGLNEDYWSVLLFECTEMIKFDTEINKPKMHIHVSHFIDQRKTWKVLAITPDESIHQVKYPYSEFYCKPNHFCSKNTLICPVVPSNEICIDSATEYLKFVQDKIGSSSKIAVIDVVKETCSHWSFKKLIDYFESSNRKKIYNQVSLEVSQLPIMNEISRPKFVEEIDWITNMQTVRKTILPQIQCYFISSVKHCYMDFHIDMSGTSVWYHVVFGIKQFCLIEPNSLNLNIYEKWLKPCKVNNVFLPELIVNKSTITFVKVRCNETLIIPSGYIHAVYTSENSIVFGGNFLHSHDIKMQFDIHAMEERKKITVEQRLPFFLEINLFMLDNIMSNSFHNKLRINQNDILALIVKECERSVMNNNNHFNSTELIECMKFYKQKYKVTYMKCFFETLKNIINIYGNMNEVELKQIKKVSSSNSVVCKTTTKPKCYDDVIIPLNFSVSVPIDLDVNELLLNDLNQIWLWHKNISEHNVNMIPSVESVNSWININEKGNFCLTTSDMERLCKRHDDGRLNDSLIQFWLYWVVLLFNQNESPVHCCKTHMYSKLTGSGMEIPTTEYDRVKTWCNKNIFKKSVVFVPVNLSNFHWIVAIILNPNSIMQYSNDFQIIICDSLMTKKSTLDKQKESKKRNITITENLLYWLREEWCSVYGKNASVEKSFTIENHFKSNNDNVFFSRGQKNGIDCGLFVCMYVHNTIQWLLDSKQTKEMKKLNDYLTKVDQIKVEEFRCQFIQLLLSLNRKQQSMKETTSNHTDIDSHDGSHIIGRSSCQKVEVKKRIIVAAKRTNVKHVLSSKSNINTDHRYETRLKLNTIEFENNGLLVDLVSPIASKYVTKNEGKNDEPIEENEFGVIEKMEYPTLKQNINNGINANHALTIVSESVLPSTNEMSNKEMNFNSKKKETDVEKHMSGKEITMIHEEDEVSNLSSSLDQSGSHVSSSTTTSRKRKSTTDENRIKKLNAIVEMSKCIGINYIRVVLTIDMSEEDIVKFLIQSSVDYDFFKECNIKHRFYWYIHCGTSKSTNDCALTAVKNKCHHYSIISEYRLIQTTNQTLVSKWKSLSFELFKESRQKLKKDYITDDKLDVDHLNNYFNRGKVKAPNIFYIECEDKGYIIDKKFTKYQQYYYNDQVEKYYGIVINDDSTTSNFVCETDSLIDAYGNEFCGQIKALWYNIYQNKDQYLYESWPGHIVPYPSYYNEICVGTDLPYFDECIEVAPFVVLSNALYLIENASLALKVYNGRLEYYKQLCNERNGININEMLASKNMNKSDEHIINEKCGMPFHKLTKICTRGKIKSIALTKKFCLLNHHSKMSDDEVIVFTLKTNGYYLCVTKKFILSSNMKKAVPYSAKVLHHYSYGSFGGIKSGIYICNINVQNSFITNFQGKYNHAAYEVGLI